MKKQNAFEIKDINTKVVIEKLKQVNIGDKTKRENHYFKNFVKSASEILSEYGYKDGTFMAEFQRNAQNFVYRLSVTRSQNLYKLTLKTCLQLTNQGEKVVKTQTVSIDKNAQIKYRYRDIVGKYEVGINHDFSTVNNVIPVVEANDNDNAYKKNLKLIESFFQTNNNTNNGSEKVK